MSFRLTRRQACDFIWSLLLPPPGAKIADRARTNPGVRTDQFLQCGRYYQTDPPVHLVYLVHLVLME